MKNSLVVVFCLSCLGVSYAFQKDPKQTPQNTVTVKVTEPVRLQTLSRPLKFYISGVVDRSGDPQPMLVYRPRGGIYLDREPKLLVQAAMEDSLKASDALSPDAQSADYTMNIYVFHFGLAEGSGREFYGKVELNVVVKNSKTGKSMEVPGGGTSIEGTAVRKKNILANVTESIEAALHEALRNLLRGAKLRDALAAMETP
jgi:hypothetical protein